MLLRYSSRLRSSAGELWRAGGRKEPVEDQPGIDLLGHRHIGRTPGDIRGIGTAIAGVAIARLRSAFDSQLERRQPGLPADFLGGHLVDRDTHANAGPVGLERRGRRSKSWPASGRGRRGRRPVLRALCWASPVKTSRSSRNGASGWSVAGSVKIETGLAWESSRADARRWAHRKTPCAAVPAPEPPGPPATAVPGPIASSQGRAMAVPRPRKTVRLDSRLCSLHRISPFRGGRGDRYSLRIAPFLEWVALDDGQHQG